MNAACHLSCTPRFSNTTSITNGKKYPFSSDPRYELRSKLETSGIRVNESSDLISFDSLELIATFISLRKLARTPAPKSPTTELSSGISGDYGYSDEAYLLQKQFMSFCSNHTMGTTVSDSCCSLAALIYMHTMLYDVSFDSRVVQLLSTRIRQFIQDGLGEDENSEGFNKILADRKTFWFLVIGGMAAEETSNRKWFVRVLKLVCCALGLGYFIGSRIVLGHILWDSRLDLKFRSLWDEISHVT